MRKSSYDLLHFFNYILSSMAYHRKCRFSNLVKNRLIGEMVVNISPRLTPLFFFLSLLRIYSKKMTGGYKRHAVFANFPSITRKDRQPL